MIHIYTWIYIWIISLVFYTNPHHIAQGLASNLLCDLGLLRGLWPSHLYLLSVGITLCANISGLWFLNMKNREVYFNSLLSKHLNISFQELARWFSEQEHSFCKHEDLSLNTQHACKKSVCLACDPSIRVGGRQADPESSLARQLSWKGELAVQWKSWTQDDVMRSGRRGHLLWPLIAHAQAHTPEYTCAHLASECPRPGSYTWTHLCTIPPFPQPQFHFIVFYLALFLTGIWN